MTSSARSRELDAAQRKRIRQERSRPVADALHLWLIEQRKKVPEGSATAKAIDYSLGRWQALTRYIDDGELPADNNWVENQIRPIAIGRNNWLFAGSLRAGKRAAAVMSLVHSARLNGHDPYAYLKDVLERLPTQPASRVDELLPHRWQAPARDYLTLSAVVKTGSPRAYSASEPRKLETQETWSDEPYAGQALLRVMPVRSHCLAAGRSPLVEDVAREGNAVSTVLNKHELRCGGLIVAPVRVT